MVMADAFRPTAAGFPKDRGGGIQRCLSGAEIVHESLSYYRLGRTCAARRKSCQPEMGQVISYFGVRDT